MTPAFPQAFDVKHPGMLTDQVKGFPALHPDAFEMLEFICEFSWKYWRIRPVVTEFGRTKAEMEAMYLETYLQPLRHEGLGNDYIHVQQAHAFARNRKSWHVIDVADGTFRAFDLRDWIYKPAQRSDIIAAVKKKFGEYPHAEALEHEVPGGHGPGESAGMHFHFARPNPLGFPVAWV